MGMVGFPEPLWNNNNKIEEKIIRNIFENIIQNGVYPTFGSPETRCNKCMFFGITCMPSPEYIGCYGGWKREKE